MSLFNRIGLAGLMVCVVAGCQSPEPSIPLQVEKSNRTSNGQERVQHMLFFDFNSSELPNNAMTILTPHANYLIANPKEKVLVAGFADEIGSMNFNYELGMKRAIAVTSVLLEMGVSQKQLIARSAGEMVPLSHEQGAKSEQRNRRVALYY